MQRSKSAMDSPSDIIERRAANALIPEAVASGLMPPVRLSVELVRALNRGLWVGGEAQLTSSALVFRPNALNKFFHDDPDGLEVIVPLRKIVAVRVRAGFVTDIIHIETTAGQLSIRCFKAKQFAQKIETALDGSCR